MLQEVLTMMENEAPHSVAWVDAFYKSLNNE